MIISLKWLSDYVDWSSLSVAELAERLTMVGLEVEAVRKQYPCLANVITARVETVKKHPKADKLNLCLVSDGVNTYQVVCGAPNLQEGAIVALALPGAVLASGIVLKETRIRGELSQGMLCSEAELGVGEDASGIWILPDDTELGIPVGRALGLDDELLEIAITPNRGDCLSVLGVAREVAAICKVPLRIPEISVRESNVPIESLASIAIEAPEGCPRYAARVIQNVTVRPSPPWLRSRLEAAGLRSINNIVDVTNYVLIEMGQPLHAFDFDLIHGHQIVVKWARRGQKFTTLDGVERELFDDTLLICDAQKPVAIAGVMGGLNSEISERTRNVLIESAFFNPTCIRRTSRKLGLRSESSYRFERGTDYDGVIRAVNRAAQLMVEVGGGEVAKGVIDVYPKPIQRPILRLRVSRIKSFLGMDITTDQIASVLASIGMEVSKESKGELVVVPPSFRHDVSREVDLAEEVARLIGYEKIPVSYPKAPMANEPVDPHWKTRQETKLLLKECGFLEIITYSFISKASLEKLRLSPDDPRLSPIQLLNPLSEEQSVMRTSLIPGVLRVAQRNFDRGNMNLRMFELSKIFMPTSDKLPQESFGLVGIMAGKRDPRPLYGEEDEIDYWDVKGIVEAVLGLFGLDEADFTDRSTPPYLEPRRSACVEYNGKVLGYLGLLALEVQDAYDLKISPYIFELDFDLLFALRKPAKRFQPLPRFPAVRRDLAVVLDEEVRVQEPLRFMKGLREPLLESVYVFDIYVGSQLPSGKKSVGYRLVYRASDRNLTDEEVNSVHARITEKVLREFNASLR